VLRIIFIQKFFCHPSFGYTTSRLHILHIQIFGQFVHMHMYMNLASVCEEGSGRDNGLVKVCKMAPNPLWLLV
jgi:hypothetical protein